MNAVAAQIHTGIARNPQTDPRVGDVVQVIPYFDTPRPSLLTVTAIDDRFIHWERNGEPHKTTLRYWLAERWMQRPAPKMELIGEAA